MSGISANWGVEGPTADENIRDTRARVMRALLATVLCAHGTPMLLAGDEFARTQHGNNNAYCQDNEVSWIDWKQAATPEGRTLTRFMARLTALRRAHPALRGRRFMHGKDDPAPGVADISWFNADGAPISDNSWNDPDQRVIVLRRAVREPDGTVPALTLLLNPTGEKLSFRLPEPHVPSRLLFDSGDPEAPERDLDGERVDVGARSAVLVIGIHQVASHPSEHA